MIFFCLIEDNHTKKDVYRKFGSFKLQQVDSTKKYIISLAVETATKTVSPEYIFMVDFYISNVHDTLSIFYQ